ncbi:transferase [Scytonema sp. NUACC26]|uniref:transferase n=1 Tax=Scytonema sp. NUACC26 TaxID=3140176 RepID=UPI0034DCA050
MSVPPLRPLRLRDSFDSYVGGEVIIHPSAVIAPGVILQAAPNSKIIIGSGVCIGMGSILQVHQGTLEVEAGANLGAGFLMVGQGKIGANACIGAATTVFNCSVDSGQVVAPGSVIGDSSRRITVSAELVHDEKEPQLSASASSTTSPPSTSRTELEQSQSNTESSTATKAEETSTKTEETSTNSSSTGTFIYGQENIQRLMFTLFPHKKDTT